MKQGKYISRDERGGFNVVKVNLPLPDARLRLFLEVKEDWLEEGLLVPVKKNKRGRIVEESSSAAQEEGAQQNYVPPFGGIPVELPRWCTNASMGEWCSYASTEFCGTQHSFCGALCTSSSATTKCGQHWRIRCKKHAKYNNHPNQCKPNG
jgi:hypothetical protein